MEYLGETIEEIAYEKGGIIREWICTITSARKEVMKVLENICKENSELL